MKAKARLIQKNDGTFRAYIENEEVYNGIKSGRLSFEDHHKRKISHYLIPASVFDRLLALDKHHDITVLGKNLAEGFAQGIGNKDESEETTNAETNTSNNG